MNRWFLFAIFFVFHQIAEAQQLPLFTQYRENNALLNPAAVSNDLLIYQHNISFGASYRNQWVGLEAGPRTQTLRGEYVSVTGNAVELLVGGSLINDQTGPTGFTGLYGRIGGVLTDDPEDNGLCFGLNLGVVQYRIKASELRLRELNDVLGSRDQSQIFPDVGVGVYYYKYLNSGFLDDSFVYGGLSIPQVMGLNLEFKGEDGQFYTKRIQHFYGLAGLIHYFGNDSFIEPSVWVKYAPGVPFNADFNIRYQMANNFWIGTGISSGANYHVEAGYLIGESAGWDNNIKIGYGFDYSFSAFGPTAGSSHEINIAYTIGSY